MSFPQSVASGSVGDFFPLTLASRFGPKNPPRNHVSAPHSNIFPIFPPKSIASRSWDVFVFLFTILGDTHQPEKHPWTRFMPRLKREIIRLCALTTSRHSSPPQADYLTNFVNHRCGKSRNPIQCSRPLSFTLILSRNSTSQTLARIDTLSSWRLTYTGSCS